MAFDFERALLQDAGPELGVTADYFVRLKQAAPTDPPDTTGMLEGQFTVPIPQVLAQLAKMVKNEFDTIYAYTVYGETMRGMVRGEIVEEFADHSDDELEHAKFLLKRMAVLGGPANVPEVEAPHPSTDPCDIVKTMIRMEQESIADWQILIKMCGDNPMRITAEEYMVKEQEHADDLWQLLQAVADPATMGAKTASKEDRERGRASAEHGLARKYEMERRTKGERSGDLVGRIAGAILGAAPGAATKNPLTALGGAAIGQHLGGKVGREAGLRRDADRFDKSSAVFGEHTDWPSGDPADSKIQNWIGKGNFDRKASRAPEAELAWDSQGQRTKSAAYVAKMAWALKRAFGEQAGNDANASMAGSGNGSVMQAGPVQDDVNATESPAGPAPKPTQSPLTDPALSSFMGAERAGTMAELQQQAAYYRQLAEQSQQSAEQSGQQLQQVQQQAGDLQQQVQQAQQQIDQSMQQAQQIQQQAMMTASSAQQIAAQSQQQHLQAVNDSMMHKQLSEQMRAGVLAMKQNIQSVLQQDPTQGIEMQLAGGGGVQGPTAGPEVQPGGPAAGAPDQEMDPGAAPPDGEQPPTANAEGGGGPAMEGAVPTGAVKTSDAKKAIRDEFKRRVPYMLAGGAIGAGITAAARPHGPKAARAVEESKAKGGGPVGDMAVAKNKMRHALAEYVDKHPVAGAAMMGSAAASAAGSAGPAIHGAVKGYLKRRKAGR